MNSVKIIQIFKIFLKLQLIIEVHSTVTVWKLFPKFRISIENIPPSIIFPTITKCINAFNYARHDQDSQKFYLGINVYSSEYIYAEVDKRYNTDDNCVLDDHQGIVSRKDIVYKSVKNLMVLINGCFIHDDDPAFQGILILMVDEFQVDFLREGLTHFNISEITVETVYKRSMKTNIFKHCQPIACDNFIQTTKNCTNGLDINDVDGYFMTRNDIIFYLIIFSVIFIMLGVALVFWFRS